MLSSRTRWKINDDTDMGQAEELAHALDVHPLIARLLIVRGITNSQDAERFLHGDVEDFHDPYLLSGMREGVERIRHALDQGEKIRVYGDYDADGVSSTALLSFLFRKLHANFDTYIPHRVLEGYGLNRAALDAAHSAGVKLIVTVDTGISAIDEIDYAGKLGIDVVVTDHHEPPAVLPEAYAVINPKQPGCKYPFKHLAGVGVAFKLAHALLNEPPVEWLDLAAVGTVADLMPLMDENRIIVKLGIERLRKAARPGLRALLKISQVAPLELTETHIGFALGPRINASGRLDSADHALRLLTTDDMEEADALAGVLDQLNKERQKLVERTVREALDMIQRNGLNQPDRKTLLLAKEGWNIGILGIVASKITEKFYRPAIVLGINPETGEAKGSARSIPDFDIFQALSACSHLLDHYGGHSAAAGLSLHYEQIDDFANQIEELAKCQLSEQHMIPILQADLCCSELGASLELIEQAKQLGPFGMGNPSPRFVFPSLWVEETRTMGKEQQHLKLKLRFSNSTPQSIDAVAFGFGAYGQKISGSAPIDLMGELSINEWNGHCRPQIIVQDMRVQDRQVFDWRGRDIVRKNEYVPDGALLLFNENEINRIPGAWLSRGCSFWTSDEVGNVRRIKGTGELEQFASFDLLQDLLLFDLPPNLEVLQLVLQQAKSVERLKAVFMEKSATDSFGVPDREAFKSVYACIQSAEAWSEDDRTWKALAVRSGVSPLAIRFILQVFEDLQFVVREGNLLKVMNAPIKKALTESANFRHAIKRQEVEEKLVYSSARELQEYLTSLLLNNGGTVNEF